MLTVWEAVLDGFAYWLLVLCCFREFVCGFVVGLLPWCFGLSVDVRFGGVCGVDLWLFEFDWELWL